MVMNVCPRGGLADHAFIGKRDRRLLDLRRGYRARAGAVAESDDPQGCPIRNEARNPGPVADLPHQRVAKVCRLRRVRIDFSHGRVERAVLGDQLVQLNERITFDEQAVGVGERPERKPERRVHELR